MPSPSPQPDPYAPRPAPTTFSEFMAHVSAASPAQGGAGITVDENLFDELFGHLPHTRGARPEFIAALARPAAPTTGPDACPVCLLSLAAIETEEEYALASESFFGDEGALGVRVLPCTPVGHVVCARCAKSWLSMNNTCPLCRAAVDPAAPQPPSADDGAASVIEQQRETEQMLALFHAVFGQRQQGGAPGSHAASSNASPTPSSSRHGERDTFAGMYS